MNGFFRNPEVKRELVIYCVLAVVFVSAGLYIDKKLGILILITVLAYTLLHFISTFRRYKQIAALSAEADKLLHGAEQLDFTSFNEGELSVLGSELNKMVLKLRETTLLLQKDKIQLYNLIADISHQLRTPLTSSNLILTLLSKSDTDEERRGELLRELRSLLSRISWLIEALLRMSKLDAGMMSLKSEAVELTELVSKACAPLAVALDIHGIELKTNLNGCFTGDINWTAEALGNLIKNSMEHMTEGGSIEISGHETPIYTELTVHDTGCGFNEDDLPHIFERFYRGKNASDGSFGIGLALARSIITAQNGTIKAENHLSGGALFIIKIYKRTI